MQEHPSQASTTINLAQDVLLSLLLRHGPMPAALLARILGMRVASTYGTLARAEAAGLVEVRCPDRVNPSSGRVWAPTWRAVNAHMTHGPRRGVASEAY